MFYKKKKNATELDNKNKILNTKVKEMENKLNSDKEDIKRLDQKKKSIANSIK